MKYLILVPTEFERDLMFGTPKNTPSACAPWLYGQYEALHVAVCGIGPAAAALATYALASRLKPEHLVLVGIAGAYPAANLALGHICQVSWDCFADLGYSDAQAVFNLDDMNLPHLPREDTRFNCHFDLVTPFDLPTASAVTVAAVTNSQTRADRLWRRFGAGLENMEGAAIAMAGASLGLPVSQIRAVSNAVGPRDPQSWLIKEPLIQVGAWLHLHLS